MLAAGRGSALPPERAGSRPLPVSRRPSRSWGGVGYAAIALRRHDLAGLERLLVLDGERLSYRTLDVEEIGSVYQAVMGFRVERRPGRALVLRSKGHHGAGVIGDIDALLAVRTADRKKRLNELAGQNDIRFSKERRRVFRARQMAVLEIEIGAKQRTLRFEELALPHLGEPLGYYVTQIGPLNQVVHLWKFDHLADLEQRHAALASDPDFAKYLAATEG
jgi:hypothetical protein